MRSFLLTFSYVKGVIKVNDKGQFEELDFTSAGKDYTTPKVMASVGSGFSEISRMSRFRFRCYQAKKHALFFREVKSELSSVRKPQEIP